MQAGSALERGRDAYARRAWSDAFDQLSAADAESPLEPDDLERLGTAAGLIGRDDDSDAVGARAYDAFVGHGELTRAARCAFWLGMRLFNRGEMAQGGGWLARAQRLVEESGEDCVERGYLLVPTAIQHLSRGDGTAAAALFDQMVQIADKHREPDAIALSRLGKGQALIRLGQISEGVSFLDEAMVVVTAGGVSPIPTGIIYCAVIGECMKIFDLRRAQEWTSALSHWCDAQPDLVPFRGECLVRRAEIMQLHGAWPDSLAEAERALVLLTRPGDQWLAGLAWYRQAELHRQRGELDEAEAAYRQASQSGHEPLPGLALLRLAQGKTDAAIATIRRVLDEASSQAQRPWLLSACAEIGLAAQDVKAARAAADELAEFAAGRDAPWLEAMSAHATGAVLLAEGDARAALATLRRAWTIWQAVDAPYEGARVRALMGQACRVLGDEDGALLEFDASRWVFQQLGAAPDLARVEALLRPASTAAPGGLTTRELQVLRLVATGRTNRAIAADLFLSEKTVARHISNIFTKLGISNRAAATAYAYEHDLV
ncbi:MAG TPA: LuxR C-terminal-related transcriptional regulator [Jiangellaceae bacterium]|nr:LuxR C-terminal-related transcriptional regulator [Jiangellaceae bacterium]